MPLEGPTCITSPVRESFADAEGLATWLKGIVRGPEQMSAYHRGGGLYNRAYPLGYGHPRVVTFLRDPTKCMTVSDQKRQVCAQLPSVTGSRLQLTLRRLQALAVRQIVEAMVRDVTKCIFVYIVKDEPGPVDEGLRRTVCFCCE